MGSSSSSSGVYPDGQFSHFLDTKLAVGDRLDVVGPFGVFTLRDGRDSDIVFVGGGAGMAPILSVLRSLAERGSTRKATYYYGARTQRDLCFEKELHALSDALPNFRYVPALSEADGDEDWDGEVGLITDIVQKHESRPGRRRLLRLRATTDGRGGHGRAHRDWAPPRRTSTTTSSPPPVHPDPRKSESEADPTWPHEERSSPKPEFTDAEAGAKVFPDSTLRHYNYYTPQKRKQSHYEDVTVEVQPDPRHYLAQGWLYGFSDGRGGYPLDWTVLKAWGVDRGDPERYPGSGGKGYDWPAHGWHEFRDPNEEWELTLYRNNANVVRQINQNIETARETKAFEQWNPNWVTFVERNVGAWMHVEHGLGLYLFANAQRRAPTNMHNNAISVNSMHRIRFAQDLALYNLTLSEEIEAFDGAAHVETWNNDPAWQGVRRVSEELTGIDDWAEAIFAANVVFEPLVGELFRSQLVQQASPGNGDFVTPTVVGRRASGTTRRATCGTRRRCSSC